MRQYIKGWITEWDMRRLTGDVTRTVVDEIAANYSEDESLSTPSGGTGRVAHERRRRLAPPFHSCVPMTLVTSGRAMRNGRSKGHDSRR